ncbi:hypothetical protein M3Y98_01000800 [Aphelenchoides besseyi]|nr:hypothetical protein M3Y98_01000800 [Aphelenchoides besseyi]
MCSNTSLQHLPSVWQDLTTVQKTCYEKGTGTKNIVVIGNSHAYIGFFGIFEQFRSITNTMTLIASDACIPVPVSLQPSDRTAMQKKGLCEIHKNGR